jgi:uncharacterized protein (TIRG00374 family)
MATTVVQRGGESGLPVELSAPSRRSRWPSVALKVGLTAVAVGMVVKTVDFSTAWERTLNQDHRFLALAAAIVLLQVFLGGMRWHVILTRLGGKSSVLESLRIFYISTFFNTWMWGAVGGDMVRAWLSYRAQASASISVSSVILDRIASVAGIALLVLVTMPLYVERVGHTLAVLVPCGLAVAGLGGIVIAGQIHRLPIDWRRNRLLRGIETLSSATRTVFLHPLSAIVPLGLAVAAQTALSMAAYSIAASLGLGLSLIDSLVLLQPVALIAALPISIGGWGIREAAMVAVLGLIGIAPSGALILSVQIGLIAVVVTLPAGVLWLGSKVNQNGKAP